MNIHEFIVKWSKVSLTESSASQQHFLDLCAILDHPTPAEMDPTGELFTFEKGAAKHGGGDGWADVWKRDYFGWEYKGKHKNLKVIQRHLWSPRPRPRVNLALLSLVDGRLVSAQRNAN